jgi:hypothetical protein
MMVNPAYELKPSKTIMSTTVKAALRIFFAVMAVLFLSLSTFKIMVSGCLILWLIDVVATDSGKEVDKGEWLHNYDE